MLKFAKMFFVLCLGIAGFSQARAQAEDGMDLNGAKVQSVDPQAASDSQTDLAPLLNRLVYISVGEVQTQKFLSQEFDFGPADSREYVREIRIVGTRTSVNISRAELELRNGQVFLLRGFQGHLSERQSRRIRLSQWGERIQAIRIWATSANLVGSRGMFRVDVLVDR